jgi:hypothetical protein
MSQERRYSFLLILSSCCVALLYLYNHYTVIGLVCIVASMVVFGLTHLLLTNGIRDPGHIYLWRAVSSKACCLVPVSLFVAYKEAGFLSSVASLHGRHYAWLATNTVVSVAAFLTGGSTLAPIYRSKARSPVSISLGLVGCIGCLSGIPIRQSYTSILLLGCYGTALVVISQLHRSSHHTVCEISYSQADTISSLECDRQSIEEDAEPIRGKHINFESTFFAAWTSRIYLLLNGQLFRAGILITSWTIFLAINFAPWPPSRVPQNFDYAYSSNQSVEVVISMYREPAEDVAALISSLQAIPSLTTARIHVYSKDPNAESNDLRNSTGAHKVTTLPNVGREGETYLHHILSQWHTLANHTLFVQAEVHQRTELLWRLRTLFDPLHTGMLDLGPQGHSFRCEGSDKWGWSDKSGVVSRVYADIYHKPCESFLLSYKGQFIVSAGRIRGVGKYVYQHLHQALSDPGSWAHNEPYLQGRPNDMSTPVFGYTMERLWGLIFQCSESPLVLGCPGVQSGSIIARQGPACQCLDNPE